MNCYCAIRCWCKVMMFISRNVCEDELLAHVRKAKQSYYFVRDEAIVSILLKSSTPISVASSSASVSSSSPLVSSVAFLEAFFLFPAFYTGHAVHSFRYMARIFCANSSWLGRNLGVPFEFVATLSSSAAAEGFQRLPPVAAHSLNISCRKAWTLWSTWTDFFGFLSAQPAGCGFTVVHPRTPSPAPLASSEVVTPVRIFSP